MQWKLTVIINSTFQIQIIFILSFNPWFPNTIIVGSLPPNDRTPCTGLPVLAGTGPTKQLLDIVVYKSSRSAFVEPYTLAYTQYNIIKYTIYRRCGSQEPAFQRRRDHILAYMRGRARRARVTSVISKDAFFIQSRRCGSILMSVWMDLADFEKDRWRFCERFWNMGVRCA